VQRLREVTASRDVESWRTEMLRPLFVCGVEADYFNNVFNFPASCVGGWQAVPVQT
jgi:hypothetical protein